MNEGRNYLDLDTWIVPGQILKAYFRRGLGNSYKPAGTEVLISAGAHTGSCWSAFCIVWLFAGAGAGAGGGGEGSPGAWAGACVVMTKDR